MRHRARLLRRIAVGVATVGSLILVPATGAGAHVHGITPLSCVGAPNAGAIQVNGTPASAVIGDGLIPSGSFGTTPGQAPIGVGDGGRDTPACPVVP